MDQSRQVDVNTLLNTIAAQLSQSQSGLDTLDRGPQGGTHGRRMAEAFRLAADAAERSDTQDAGRQLALAAEAMRERGEGKAARFYANGLQAASQQFSGQSGISLDQLLPFLQAFLGGVQRNNPAQPGQGTMIDALQPALDALSGSQRRGQDPQTAITDALTAALGGAKQTERAKGDVDPGAASAVNILGGIVAALAPSIIGALTSGRQSAQQQQYPSSYPQAGATPAQGQDPFGGLGGLLGGFLNQRGQGTVGTGDLNSLLDDLREGRQKQDYA